MHPTYPETHVYPWENSNALSRAGITKVLRLMARQGGSLLRRQVFCATADALDAVADARGLDAFTGKQVKRVLVTAAREHGWYVYAQEKAPPPLPAPTQEGNKVCFKCRQEHPLSAFLVRPSVAQAENYGMPADTTRKVQGLLCPTCRKTKQARLRKVRARNNRRLEGATPDMAERVALFTRVRNQIATHMNRVQARIAQATVRVPTTDGDELREQYWRNPDMGEFYRLKHELLTLARQRLNALLGEPTPIPAKWGMLLTPDERKALETAHTRAYARTTGKKPVPALW